MHTLVVPRPLGSTAQSRTRMGVIAQRTSMAQAASMRRRLAEAHGQDVSVGGRRAWTLPAPEALLSVDRFPGIGVVANWVTGGLVPRCLTTT